VAADTHRFRFFVDRPGREGAVVRLSAADSGHVHVLRMAVGHEMDIVDTDGHVWAGRFTGDEDQVACVELEHPVSTMAEVGPRVELIAGSLSGNRFDELVNGAVQAGATSVTPLISSQRDRERLTQRRDRLQRLAVAAAKQSKQTRIADVRLPIDMDEVLAGPAGIVLDARGDVTLDHVDLGTSDVVRMLIGPADGLSADTVAALVGAGWTAVRLGPSILRSELAAAVATAIVAMRCTPH
jgi:16S rRNA (uracil1498-N3)-methyltransferase